jgi:CheY-specific phosphatase CheX
VSAVSVEALARLSSAVLADCAFLLTEPAEASHAPNTDAVVAVVDVYGEPARSLTLSLPRSLAVVVAADMLGIGPDDPESEAQAESAVAELANVLVGSLVERFCEGEACDIGLPSLLSREPAVSTSGDAHTANLLADSGDLVRVIWTVSPRVPS